MPLAGDAADTIGNRFEAYWTVTVLAEVLAEELESVWFAPLGEEGDGVEFRVTKAGRHAYHQVKRQLAGTAWSLSALKKAGVLGNAWARLTESPDATFVFASVLSAGELEELTERARQADSAEKFERFFVEDRRMNGALAEVKSAWGRISDAEAWDALRRLEVHAISEETVKKVARVHLRPLVRGDTDAVINFLFSYAFANPHHEVTSTELWRELESRGFQREDWASNHLVLAEIEKANDRYLRRVGRDLIGGQLIPRREAEELLGLLAFGGKRGALLDGSAGVKRPGFPRGSVRWGTPLGCCLS